jgi:hypothetical protein
MDSSYHLFSLMYYLCKGNISRGNQHLHANYGNFNLSHTMLIQRGAQRRWKEWFAKSPLQITPPTSHEFCKSPLPPPMSSPLDQDRVTQIEVSIVCTKRLVFTRYVPLYKIAWNIKLLNVYVSTWDDEDTKARLVLLLEFLLMQSFVIPAMSSSFLYRC